jgi:hypothetical protein
MIFERKIRRKIFGPARSDYGNWRIKINQEINELINGKNIIGFIKMQRLRWSCHVDAWLMIIMLKRSRVGNPCQKDQLEGLKHVGKMTFWKIQETGKYMTGRMWRRIETDGRKWLNKPELCVGCSAL